MSVSVIICAFNSEEYISRAIHSCLGQKFVNEILVVNDASDDSTSIITELIAKNNPEVRLFNLPENHGPSFARNFAIKNAKSDYVAILDADDILLPNRFEKLFNVKGWDFIADDIIFSNDLSKLDIDKCTTIITKSVSIGEFISRNINKTKVSRAEMGFMKPVFKKSLFIANDIWYNEKIRLAEDYDIYCRLLIKGSNLKIINQVGYAAEVRFNSLSTKHSSKELYGICEIDVAIEKMLHELGDVRALGVLVTHYRLATIAYLKARFLEDKKSLGHFYALSKIFKHGHIGMEALFKLVTEKFRNLTSKVLKTQKMQFSKYMFTPEDFKK